MSRDYLGHTRREHIERAPRAIGEWDATDLDFLLGGGVKEKAEDMAEGRRALGERPARPVERKPRKRTPPPRQSMIVSALPLPRPDTRTALAEAVEHVMSNHAGHTVSIERDEAGGAWVWCSICEPDFKP